MKSKFFNILLLPVLFLISTTSYVSAGTRICSKQESVEEAEGLATTAKSWGELHQQFKRYIHCDDGAIAEGFSESISVLLAEQWKDIGQLGDVLKSDPDFQKFVIRHIDETIPADRLSRIAKYADKSCPQNLKNLCRDILVKARPK
jgi:hypothetical protein